MPAGALTQGGRHSSSLVTFRKCEAGAQPSEKAQGRPWWVGPAPLGQPQCHPEAKVPRDPLVQLVEEGTASWCCRERQQPPSAALPGVRGTVRSPSHRRRLWGRPMHPRGWGFRHLEASLLSLITTHRLRGPSGSEPPPRLSARGPEALLPPGSQASVAP